MLVINTLASLELDAVLEFHDKQLDMGISDFFFILLSVDSACFFFPSTPVLFSSYQNLVFHSKLHCIFSSQSREGKVFG